MGHRLPKEKAPRTVQGSLMTGMTVRIIGDGGLRALLSACCTEASSLVEATAGVPTPDGDDGYLWRWALLYLVLAADFGESVLELANGSHNRALLVLRRIPFEYMVRLKYYCKYPEVARADLDDFHRQASKFKERLPPGAFDFIADPSFDPTTHKKPDKNFELILKDVLPDRASELYAQFYSFPSALVHGLALAFIDITSLDSETTVTLHQKSSRTDVNRDVLYNFCAFFVALLADAAHLLGMGKQRTVSLHSRLLEAARTLGIETYK